MTTLHTVVCEQSYKNPASVVEVKGKVTSVTVKITTLHIVVCAHSYRNLASLVEVKGKVTSVAACYSSHRILRELKGTIFRAMQW